MTAREPIRLVVFDWAGTTVDYGCFAPVAPFVLVLRRNGVHVSVEQAREPMGLDKKEHLRLLLALPGAAADFRKAHGRDATEADVDRMFEEMVPLAIESVREHSHVIDGVIEVAAELRRPRRRDRLDDRLLHRRGAGLLRARRRRGLRAGRRVLRVRRAAGAPRAVDAPPQYGGARRVPAGVRRSRSAIPCPTSTRG